MGKLIERADLAKEISILRATGRTIVLTNGCFDLLHVGHARYLADAARLGGALVVGVNADSSVTLLKGIGRPLVPATERAELVASLASVELAVVFNEPTADALLADIRPDVYVKGGDYGPGKTLPEMATARALGIRVELLPVVPGRSTSSLIADILRRFGGLPGSANDC